ncbi:GntR family transcriptional regulator [Oligosphaera ethanolica]|uniref:DNA-binding LacI/PurR family transcriptional regulator n=1 Tax=Oligosphaera ethanolica TaxID=760260 RepID=A0AAE4AMD2_9BACT|nr:GntR family transcriptional regulator [Oligosphaera ethanolica]MDQ0288295.1 DNA-binding LacI/PurR family transcriptional regulator [Oligosphaera ethanolica]
MNITSKRKNLAQSIRNQLYNKIMAGQYRSGTALASNKELAEEFGVSVLTADRAVRQLVVEGLVYREQGRGTFVSELPSKTGTRTYRIGIGDVNHFPLTPALKDALDAIPKTLSMTLREQHCEPSLLEYQEIENRDRFAKIAATLDAFILSRAYLDAKTMANLATVPQLPVLVIETETVLDLPYHQVVMDCRRGLQQAAAKITALAPPDIIAVYEQHKHGVLRLSTFREELAAAGYPMERCHDIAVDEWGVRSGVASYRLGMKLSKDLKVKFVFSTSDVVSLSMLEAFFDAGLNPGKDFQLLSVDNIEGAGYSPFATPLLTTVNSLTLPVAQRAAELMLQILQKPADEHIIVRLPSALVIRDTAFAP